jgi:hypothetical protein
MGTFAEAAIVENGTNGKRQLQFVFCKRKTKMAILSLITAKRNGKKKVCCPWTAIHIFGKQN